jgi:hypothetical protein
MVWSVMIWVFNGLFIRLPDHPDGMTFGFNPLGYQILYVFGLVIGEKAWQLGALAPALRKRIVVFSAGLTASFFLLRLAYASSESCRIFLGRVHPLFSMNQMGPVRVLSFAAFVILLVHFIEPLRGSIVNHAIFTRWLVPMGQISLWVFMWHILAIYAARSVLTPASPELWRIMDLIVAVASLSIPVLILKRAGRSAPLFPHPFRRIQPS